MCITKECEDPTAPGVWWRDDEEWKQYGFWNASRIRSYMASKGTSRNRVKLWTIVSSKYPRGSRYAVDLSTMQQINLTTGYRRDIKVINTPTTASASAEVDSIKEELRAYRQELGDLKMLVDELKENTVVLKMTTSKNTTKEVAALASSPDAWGEWSCI